MATIYDMVVIAHDETTANAQRDLVAETGYTMLAGLKLKEYFGRIVTGIRPGVVQTKVNMAKASGTITFDGVDNDDVVTISGVGFTAKTSGAAGATEFNLGANDTAAAVNAIAAFNAHTTLDGIVICTSSASVITVTALVPGELGNAVTIEGSDSSVGVSGARLTGGTNGDVERTHNYGSGA